MTQRAPACSQAVVIPISSSPQRTEERPTSQAESSTTSGTARELVDVVAEPRAVDELRGRRTSGSPRECRPCAATCSTSTDSASSETAAAVAASPTSTARAGPGLGRGAHLVLGARDPRAGDEPGGRRSAAASYGGPATRSRDWATVTGRPAARAAASTGTPASTPDGVSTTRRSPTASSSGATSSAASASSRWRRAPRARSRPSRPGRSAAAMSRSGSSPPSSAVELGAVRRGRPRSSPSAVTTSATTAVGGHDVRDQRGVVVERGLQLGERHRVGDLAGAPVLPGPLAHPLPQLGLALGPSAPPRRAISRSSAGRPTSLRVLRRAHRLDPAGQHPGPLGPLEEHRGLPRLHRQRQPAHAEPGAVAGHPGLQVEGAERALPGVQVVEPGAQVPEGGRPAAVRPPRARRARRGRAGGRRAGRRGIGRDAHRSARAPSQVAAPDSSRAAAAGRAARVPEQPLLGRARRPAPRLARPAAVPRRPGSTLGREHRRRRPGTARPAAPARAKRRRGAARAARRRAPGRGSSARASASSASAWRWRSRREP